MTKTAISLSLLVTMTVLISANAAYIEPLAKTDWGHWGPISMCPNGGHANSFALKVEGSQGGGDDTALNGIKLYCSKGGSVESNVGPWGTWSPRRYCPGNTVFDAAVLRSEGKQGGGDDTAANNVDMICQGGVKVHGSGKSWGRWSHTVSCHNRVICGIQTKVESRQGWGDDTALNRVRFYCC